MLNFFGFLCHYHLQNNRQCCDSLRDLHLIIEKNYLIGTHNLQAVSYNILGIGFKMLGDKKAARKAFVHSIELFPNQKLNGAFQQLAFFN